MPSGSGTLRRASAAIFNSRPRYHNLRSVLLPPFTASELKVHRGRSPCPRAFSPGKYQSQSQNSGQADLETQAVPLARTVQNLKLSESGGPSHRGWKWGLEAEAGGDGGVSLGRSSREAAKVSPHGALGPEKGYVEGFFRGILASGLWTHSLALTWAGTSLLSLLVGGEGSRRRALTGPEGQGRVLRSVPTGPQTETRAVLPKRATVVTLSLTERKEGAHHTVVGRVIMEFPNVHKLERTVQ